MNDSLRSPKPACVARCARVVGALLALAAVSSALADTLTFNPTKDAMVKFKFPDQNFGTDPLLQVSNQTGFQKHIFIQFVVSGIPSGATNIVAKLHLNSQVTGTGRSITAHTVTNTSWGENTITWNNAPALGTSLATVSSFTSGQDAIWDVSGDVTGNGTFALGLDGTFSGDTTFSSRDSTPQPSLVITYTPPSIGPLSTTPVAGTPGFSSSTWQPPPSSHKNDGRVDAILQAGNVVYVGTDSDQIWDNGSTVAGMTHLTAYNLTTGRVITTWKPAPDARIYDIKLSADGTKLWVAGDFSTICGAARTGVAVLNALTGPGDTSPASVTSQLNVSVTGGFVSVRSIVLDDANNRAWVGGSFTAIGGTTRNGVAKFSWNGTNWVLDTGFDPGTTIDIAGGAPNTTFGVVRSMVLKPDGTKLVVGGQFLWTNPGTTNGYMAAFNPTTGATMTWSHKFTYDDPNKETPGIFDVAGDATCVYLSGGYNSGNITVCTDWNGSGSTSLTPLALNTPKTFLANWYYASDGNNQCMTLAVINGVNVCLSGSHGDFVATAKNTNDAGGANHIASGKIYAVTTGASGGVLQGYGNPPAFTAPNNSGNPLGPWSFYYNAATGSLHVGGDFTACNSEGANTHRRYARFDAQ